MVEERDRARRQRGVAQSRVFEDEGPQALRVRVPFLPGRDETREGKEEKGRERKRDAERKCKSR